ncbi:MAG: hypothetical protein ACP5J8_02375 [Minisyncoccia bacterium]
MNYSYLQTIKKVIKQLIILTLTLIASGLMTEYPATANFVVFGTFTVYGLLQFLVDYLKHRWNVQIP